MGLDMYLYAKKYNGGGWEHSKPEEKEEFENVIKAISFKREDVVNSIQIKVTVGYWRKANAIHKWFVENCQDGVDECQYSYVDREELTELKTLCEKVIAGIELVDGNILESTSYEAGKPPTKNFEKGQVIKDPSVAIEALPSTSGFFFGGTDYDEFYIQDLKDTAEIIDRCLALPKDWDFEYHSSW